VKHVFIWMILKMKKRYCTPSESLEQSLKEMKLIREGKIPKKSWNDLKEELKKEGRYNGKD